MPATAPEPFELPAILADCDPPRPGELRQGSLAEAERRVRAAFLGRVCGCILGKPVEGAADLESLRKAGAATGEWPLDGYLSEAFLDALGNRHHSWTETVRGRIKAVAPDDDINYTLLALTVLEGNGLDFTRDDLRRAWLLNLAPGWTWGPEREFLSRAALATRGGAQDAAVDEQTLAAWVASQNAAPEHCGAAIRADAYGYACMGDPARAAALAWRDAGMTHRGAGIYGAMFIAAAIAAAPAVPAEAGPLAVFELALRCVPRASRFHEIMTDCLGIVRAAPGWIDAYDRIHAAYGRYGFCQVYQELGTVMNTLRFARGVAHGICIQVSQGNDTDSFGATAGSLLGAWFGPGTLPRRWTRPFRNRILTTLATFHEQDFGRVVDRVSRLPRLGR